MDRLQPSYDLAQLLPHRPPFLLVDRVIFADPQAGHLRAVSAAPMTQFLLLEALSQAAACVNGLSLRGSGESAHHGYLVAASDFQFPNPLQKGAVVHLEVRRLTQLPLGGAKAQVLCAFSAHASLSSEPGLPAPVVATGRLVFAVGQG